MTKGIFSVLYELHTSRPGAFRINQNTQEAAAGFVRERIVLPAAYGLVLLATRLTGFDGLVVLDRPIPGLTGFDFGLTIRDVPLLTQEYSRPWIGIVVDSAGFVRSFSATIPHEQVVQQEITQTISLSDAVGNLNAGRGVLLSSSQDPESGYGEEPIFGSGIINEASLVYVPVANVLRPAFLLEGSGEKGDLRQFFSALVLASP